MDDTVITLIAVFIASIIMFVVPFIIIADRADDISQLLVQNATAEFVDDVIKSGKITTDSYRNFIKGLQVSGNTYEIDLEIKILDENTSKTVTDSDVHKIGSNTYYSIFTTQVEERLGISEENKTNNTIGKLILKQGDEISITVKNSSSTISQLLKNIYYKTPGEETHIIAATASGTIAINGTR